MVRRRLVVLGSLLAVLAGLTPLALVGGSSSAPGAPPRAIAAGADTGRTVRLSYTGPAATLPLPGAAPVVVAAGVAATAARTEDRVTVSLRDQSRSTVGVVVDFSPRGARTPLRRVYCVATFTLAIQPGSRVITRPLAGRCPTGRLSAPTYGSVTLRFHPMVRPAVVPPSQRWALVIGIGEYAGRTHDTYGGYGDAVAVRRSLLRAGWRADHIEMVLDERATATAITAAMRRLAARSGPDTFTLFHFSGHMCIASRGPCAPGHTYLWSTDNRFISEDTVASILGRVRGNAWFDFAGCQAAAFDRGLSSRTRMVTASSQADETSYERPDWGRSVWTGLVWHEGFIKGYAAPSGRPYRATIGQMVQYGKQRAPAMTRGGEVGSQHPYSRGGNARWTLWAPRPA